MQLFWLVCEAIAGDVTCRPRCGLRRGLNRHGSGGLSVSTERRSYASTEEVPGRTA